MNRFYLKIAKNSTILYRNTRSFTLASTNHAGYTKDFKPGEYPQTEEERKAAALKYGLRPEDYKPMADDGYGYGDYPDLPFKGTELKDPYAEYDDFYMRRNYADPVQIYGENLVPELIANQTQKISFGNQFLLLVAFASTFFGLCYLTRNFQLGHCITKKQYPRNVAHGEKHFEI